MQQLGLAGIEPLRGLEHGPGRIEVALVGQHRGLAAARGGGQSLVPILANALRQRPAPRFLAQRLGGIHERIEGFFMTAIQVVALFEQRRQHSSGALGLPPLVPVHRSHAQRLTRHQAKLVGREHCRLGLCQRHRIEAIGVDRWRHARKLGAALLELAPGAAMARIVALHLGQRAGPPAVERYGQRSPQRARHGALVAAGGVFVLRRDRGAAPSPERPCPGQTSRKTAPAPRHAAGAGSRWPAAHRRRYRVLGRAGRAWRVA